MPEGSARRRVVQGLGAALLVLLLAALDFASGGRWLAGLPAPASAEGAASAPAAGWPVYAGDPGGRRYSPLDSITPKNVDGLEIAWEYHTGDLRDAEMEGRNHAFQSTPILVGDTLYFCSPRSRIHAVDARSGERRWVHDPKVDLSLGHYNFNCRGVAVYVDPGKSDDALCKTKILVATADARLIAVDAPTGERCLGFGRDGEATFYTDVGGLSRSEYGISSPPIVVNDVVVLGSSVGENRRTDMPSGKVHAFDARTGALRWTWDPVPRDPDDPARATWKNGSADRTGGANVWSLGSADPERDLVFLPTSSPSPDWYGGERLGDNRNADSVVALRASTGELVWAFQMVHHNLWDYDIGSQPVLFDLEHEGRKVAALAQATKMGHLFLLDRETGKPLFPVEERPVPTSDVPGEEASPTQPFPSWPPPLVPQGMTEDDAFGLTPIDRALCRRRIRELRSEGIFTPPSLGGTIVFPGTAGGMNWGSVAWDPVRKLLVFNTNRVANTIKLVPREEAEVESEKKGFLSTSPMKGTPYVARFGVLLSPFGVPCNKPPWGTIAALDLSKKELAWESTLGTTRDLAPVPLPLPLGTPNMGGPLVTAGGVVFIGAALDDYLRAFDVESGEELWKGRLPAGGQATPMTYRVAAGEGQFVVIAAGGHSQMRSRAGDSLVAFALPN